MNKHNAFWPSYADLMTSLFFVMFVLYAVTFHLFQKQHEKLLVDSATLQRLKAIQASVDSLENTGLFRYQPSYKRFEFNRDILFDKGQYKIKPEYEQYLIEAGKAIKRLVELELEGTNFRYLIIIEGMASADSFKDNDLLSYKRSLALYKFWNEHDEVKLDSKVTEIQIAGSGEGGMGRYRGSEIHKNQRFLIQIIPKTNLINSPTDTVKFK